MNRGNTESFCDKSRECVIDASEDGPLQQAFTTKEEVSVVDTSQLARAELAKQFGIKEIHFIPVEGGVLEFGTPNTSFLSGNLLDASLKMRCDTSGAGYAVY